MRLILHELKKLVELLENILTIDKKYPLYSVTITFHFLKNLESLDLLLQVFQA